MRKQLRTTWPRIGSTHELPYGWKPEICEFTVAHQGLVLEGIHIPVELRSQQRGNNQICLARLGKNHALITLTQSEPLEKWCNERGIEIINIGDLLPMWGEFYKTTPPTETQLLEKVAINDKNFEGDQLKGTLGTLTNWLAHRDPTPLANRTATALSARTKLLEFRYAGDPELLQTLKPLFQAIPNYKIEPETLTQLL